jgi:hypothetical protein
VKKGFVVHVMPHPLYAPNYLRIKISALETKRIQMHPQGFLQDDFDPNEVHVTRVDI